MGDSGPLELHWIWHAIGIVGGVIFYGRFYVQWIASERAGKSVMPIVFWYMSSVGSVLLMAFAFVSRSPVGALGQSFNLVVYSRNLVHIWRERGILTPRRHRAIHAAVLLIGLAAVALVARVWWNEYEVASGHPEDVSRLVWFWLALGVIGQALFAARFLVQWYVTERQRQSVIPTSFWYLSVAASMLQATSFLQRREWVFGIGMIATLFIYFRNIWFIRRDAARLTADASS